MQNLNLINKEKSDIDYSVSRFPDGEVQITLSEIDHKDEVRIYCRITSAEELFILGQVCDILRRHGMYFTIHIFYLMGMRMDRVMDFNRPFTLSIVCSLLDNLGADVIEVFSPHSREWERFFKHTHVAEMFVSTRDYPSKDNYQLVYPDKGARSRYIACKDNIFGTKVRDLETGRIVSIGIENPEIIGDRPLLIMDDLCDGGGTFVGVAEAIRKVKPDAVINISVDHMVNPRGIENLSKNFNHVWFTNSYKDWKKDWEHQPTPFPANITQINIV